MTDPAVVFELRQVRAELAELPRLVRQAVAEALAAQHTPLAPPHRRVLDLLAEVYKADEPFTSSELLALAAQRLTARVPLRQALQDLCGMDARRLGIALRQIADSRAVADGVRLEGIKAEAGSRVWVLRGIEGIESLSVLRHAPAPCASCKTSSQSPRSA